MRVFLLVASAFLFSVQSLPAVSFPCTQAKSPREKAVCASASLSAQDDRLAAAYQAIHTELSTANAALVEADQRAWLALVDKICPADSQNPNVLASCLQDEYTQRIGQLEQSTQTVGGIRFFTRSHFLFRPAPAHAKPPLPIPVQRPFGYGEYAWPQIDRPDNDQAVWNQAVAAAALRIEGARDGGQAPNLDLAVDGGGYRVGTFQIYAANNRLISVSFALFRYEWGGAHGGTAPQNFDWWLDRRRPLAWNDVFRPDAAWQPRVIALALAALRKDPGQQDLWQDPKELAAGVLQGVKVLGNWNLGSTGANITFGEYGVGPYAIGMPSPTLSWETLNGLLAPDLHPETLPQPVPKPQ